MNSAEERVIAESLEALESGRSIEEILAEHPEHVEALRLILATAANLASLKIAHSIGAQSNSLDQFLGEASARKAAGVGSKRPLWLFGRRLVLSLSVMLLLLVIISFPLTFAAQSAIPGDALYNAKVVIEDIRLSLVGDGFGRDRLTDEFNQNRIEEIEELMASGRSASGIEYTGFIEAIDGQAWIISGLPVIVSDSLATSGQMEVGQGVITVVDVHDGEIEATRIVKPSSLENSPEPGPVTTREAEDDVEPDPEASPTLEATPTLKATPTATAELSETPEPTMTANPIPDEIIIPDGIPTAESEDHESFEDDDGSDTDDDEDDESEDNSGSGDDDSGDDDSDGRGSGSDDDDIVDDGNEDDSSDSDDDSSGSSDEEDEKDEEDKDDEIGDSSDSDDDNSGSSHEEDEKDEDDEDDEKGDSGGGS